MTGRDSAELTVTIEDEETGAVRKVTFSVPDHSILHAASWVDLLVDAVDRLGDNEYDLVTRVGREMERHFDRGGYCDACGGDYPCLTRRNLVGPD